jgi:hypothetical protein
MITRDKFCSYLQNVIMYAIDIKSVAFAYMKPESIGETCINLLSDNFLDNVEAKKLIKDFILFKFKSNPYYNHHNFNYTFQYNNKDHKITSEIDLYNFLSMYCNAPF